MKKITLATIKSFIRKNKGNLFIKNLTDFDGMVDCVMPCRNSEFNVAEETIRAIDNTLGINGAWFVGRSNDFFEEYLDKFYTGYKISNCCGSFIIAINN